MTRIQVYKGLVFFTLLTLPWTAFAGDEPKVEKKKNYSKTVTISSSDKISLTNQFGQVKLTTWDRNELKVDVSITAKANSDERAQEILDAINIDDGKNGSGVYFKTKMDQKHSGRRNGDRYKNEGFSIDYAVSLPSRNTLALSNSFGETIIPSYSGEIDVVSKFGRLETGALSNVKAVLVEFGSAEIESINNGKLIVKFSRAIVHRMSGSVDATFEHSSGVKISVDNDIKQLDVRNNFSTLYLQVSRNLSADFDIRTHFGEVSNKTDFAIKKEDEDEGRHGPRFDYRYRGKSGTGSIAMKIRSEFGQVIVGHNLEMSIKEAKKEKEKKQVRTI